MVFLVTWPLMDIFFEYHSKATRKPSGFTKFLGDSQVREDIKEENPDVTFGEMARLMGAKWKTLGAAERKVSLHLSY